MFKSFWDWYNKHYTLNITVAALLFTLQLVHLYWLSADVVLPGLGFASFFPISGFWQTLLLLVDYTEIPALITTSLVYINELRKGFSLKNFLYLIFLNSQFLHIFWITDEYVVEHLSQTARHTLLPLWLAWLAIVIDYLELPVIAETLKKLYDIFRKKEFNKLKEAFEED